MAVESKDDGKDYSYMSGFGSHFETEVLKGALPIGQNSPQVVSPALPALPIPHLTPWSLSLTRSAPMGCTQSSCQVQPSLCRA